MEWGWASSCLLAVDTDHAQRTTFEPGEPPGIAALRARLYWVGAVVVSDPPASTGVGTSCSGGFVVCLSVFSRKSLVFF